VFTWTKQLEVFYSRVAHNKTGAFRINVNAMNIVCGLLRDVNCHMPLHEVYSVSDIACFMALIVPALLRIDDRVCRWRLE